MIGNPYFYVEGPLHVTGTITGDVAQFDFIRGGTVDFQGGTGQFNQVVVTERFFPPKLSFEQRTGIWSGVLTPEVTEFDGLMVYQTTNGQKLMIVQSGVWKDVNLL